MKTLLLKSIFSLSVCLLADFLFAQTPGIIVRPASGIGANAINPNGDGFTSVDNSGFGSDDIANSEIPYKVVLPTLSEPTGDLLRGPSGLYSDIVRTFDGSGFYLYNDGTNFMCRLRIGGIVSGSKGYSVLLDTDQKFGASGPNADPNYQAATTGVNGNPGFELEVVLETNFRIAIYNVDGTSTPVLITSYTINSHSQVSVASTRDGNDPDYFYDFFVPFSAMGINGSTSLRAIATTVMSPGPAIGGPKSDIYGLSGDNYMSDWETGITSQPVFTLNNLTNAGSGITNTCTQAPTLNNPLTPSSVSANGTWTALDASKPQSATITLFKNGTSTGLTTTVSSGNVWTIPISGLANGDVITAKAQATGESQCLSSNPVTVNSCTNGTHTTAPVVSCSSTRGFEGSMALNARVFLYRLTSAGYVLYADDATTTYKVTYPTTTTWRYDNVNTQSGSACTGGAADITAGSYAVLAQLSGSCISTPVIVCVGALAATATPTITSALTIGTTSISGTAAANSSVQLWVDGYFLQSATASAGGAYTISFTTGLQLSQTVEIRAVAASNCIGAAVSGSVTCYVTAPVITSDTARHVAVGSQLSGTSSEASGSTVIIYNGSTNAVIGTTTVQSNGTWTLSSPTIGAGLTYYAKATTPCNTSAASSTVTVLAATSPTRCGTIAGPITASATTVSGTVATPVAGTLITLYEDDVAIDTVSTWGTAWSISVGTDTLYTGGVLTISIKEPSKTEAVCSATQTVSCNIPNTPSVDPTSSAIATGSTITYTITGTQGGILYSVTDANGKNYATSIFGNGGTQTITSNAFDSAATYNLIIKATNFAGSNCESSTAASLTVSDVVPVMLLSFDGRLLNKKSYLSWTTSQEFNSRDFEIFRSDDQINFKYLGRVNASGNTLTMRNYNFIDEGEVSNVAFYKLKLINKDGTYAESKVIAIHAVDNAPFLNMVKPNPFVNQVEILINADHQQRIAIKLTDATGRVVLQQQNTIVRGPNVITLQQLYNLPAGNYFLKVTGSKSVLLQEKLFKNSQ
jgi:hypothetical protein